MDLGEHMTKLTWNIDTTIVRAKRYRLISKKIDSTSSVSFSVNPAEEQNKKEKGLERKVEEELTFRFTINKILTAYKFRIFVKTKKF